MGSCLSFHRRRFREQHPRLRSGGPLRTAQVIEKRRKLQQSIDKLRLLQARMMPNVLQLLAKRPHVISHDELPEEQPLMFPSDLTAEERLACAPELMEIEDKLRDGQMHDALNNLRIHLHTKTRLINFKNRHIPNQLANTRARRKIDANDIKVTAFAQRYRQARSAKHRLVGPGEWERTWRALADSDVRTLQGDVHEPAHISAPEGTLGTLFANESEGRRRTSWIWLSADQVDADGGEVADMHAGLSLICSLSDI